MGLTDIVHEWQRRRKVEDEIAHLDPAILAETGVDRESLLAVAQMSEDEAQRFKTMAGVFGVPEGALEANRAVQADVARVCARCGATRACHEELSRPGGGRVDHVEFCPNADTYKALTQG